MTRDEQLIKAALDMAATHARAAFDARSTSRKGHHSLLDWTDGYDEATRACAAAIRAIAPADVLAKAGTSSTELEPPRLMAMTDADRAAVARKFNARMEMTRRDGRLIWAKAGA